MLIGKIAVPVQKASANKSNCRIPFQASDPVQLCDFSLDKYDPIRQLSFSQLCYFLEGSVVVTPENGEPVQIGKGDLVVFPEGMDCVWEIKEPVRKHYLFG